VSSRQLDGQHGLALTLRTRHTLEPLAWHWSHWPGPSLTLFHAPGNLTGNPSHPTVGLCLGPYGGPGGGAVSYERGTHAGNLTGNTALTAGIVLDTAHSDTVPTVPPSPAPPLRGSSPVLVMTARVGRARHGPLRHCPYGTPHTPSYLAVNFRELALPVRRERVVLGLM